MNENRILIIGSNGQLGKELQKKYPKAIAIDYETLDISNEVSINNFNWKEVDVIINAAAYTNVDGAETQDGRIIAWKVNAVGPALLSKIANKLNKTLIHISSDYVFDGSSKDSHSENEPFSPLSVYGQSKTAGDIAVGLIEKYYLIRTSWVIGDGKNFVRTMLDLANKGISPSVVSDQVGRLTFTSELVRAIDYLLQNKCPYGVYNITNDGEPASWADITRKIFKLAGKNELKVSDVSTEQYYKDKIGAAPRPLNSVMDLNKIHSTGFKSKDWYNDLSQYIEKELEKK